MLFVRDDHAVALRYELRLRFDRIIVSHSFSKDTKITLCWRTYMNNELRECEVQVIMRAT